MHSQLGQRMLAPWSMFLQKQTVDNFDALQMIRQIIGVMWRPLLPHIVQKKSERI